MSSKTQQNIDEHKRIPVYNLEGTHYEYSVKLGQLTKERIEERMKKEAKDLEPLFEFIKTDEGLNYFNAYTKTIQNEYPWYYDELRGLCDGSGIALNKILVLNYKNELKAANELEKTKENNEQGRSSCSTISINRLDNNEHQLYIVHNEDESDANWNTCFILQANIKSCIYTIDESKEQRASPNERYIAFGYAGQLVGNGFAANHHGFVFTYNGLYPKKVLKDNCLPRQFHNRVLLSIENEQQLDQLLRTQLTAYGFNVNIGRFRCPDSIAQKYLLNYEIGPSNNDGKTNQYHINYTLNEKQMIDAKTNKNNNENSLSTYSLNYYCHFNHYIHIETILELTCSLRSSKMRAQRAAEFDDIKTSNQALEFLGDEKYKSKHPVFRRSSTGQTNTVTLCTISIDLNKSMIYLYDDNPTMNNIVPFFEFGLDSL